MVKVMLLRGTDYPMHDVMLSRVPCVGEVVDTQRSPGLKGRYLVRAVMHLAVHPDAKYVEVSANLEVCELDR
jgi:hypothetical protein